MMLEGRQLPKVLPRSLKNLYNIYNVATTVCLVELSCIRIILCDARLINFSYLCCGSAILIQTSIKNHILHT